MDQFYILPSEFSNFWHCLAVLIKFEQNLKVYSSHYFNTISCILIHIYLFWPYIHFFAILQNNQRSNVAIPCFKFWVLLSAMCHTATTIKRHCSCSSSVPKNWRNLAHDATLTQHNHLWRQQVQWDLFFLITSVH